MEIANGPADGSGVKILPGEIGQGAGTDRAGTAIDYEGASACRLIGPGESAGRYREFEIKDGKYETVTVPLIRSDLKNTATARACPGPLPNNSPTPAQDAKEAGTGGNR